MQLNPHLTFQGQCEAAFHFYEECLGGRIVMMMKYSDSPLGEQAEPGWRDKIIHTTLALGDQRLSGADAPSERYQKPQGFSVQLNVGDAAEAERIFTALAEKGAVQMPLQQTFWAVRFGMLVDQFGTPWMINCEPPA
ncbi:MAG TPA: VOC family protein [Bryobacteraceae bacterium]|nr:VOC family protein [Bryobacteraceae bacterium]